MADIILDPWLYNRLWLTTSAVDFLILKRFMVHSWGEI